MVAPTSSSCAFCEIVAGREPCQPVVINDDTITIYPLNPATPGHTLTIPRMHVADAAADPDIAAIVMRDAARYAASEGVPFNLITSAGADATQTVLHLHVHYVPRREDDGLALPWTKAP